MSVSARVWSGLRVGDYGDPVWWIMQTWVLVIRILLSWTWVCLWWWIPGQATCLWCSVYEKLIGFGWIVNLFFRFFAYLKSSSAVPRSARLSPLSSIIHHLSKKIGLLEDFVFNNCNDEQSDALLELGNNLVVVQWWWTRHWRPLDWFFLKVDVVSSLRFNAVVCKTSTHTHSH